MGRRVESITSEVDVSIARERSQLLCTRYRNLSTSDEGFIGRHADPVSGLCPNPEYRGHRKTKI